MDLGINRMGKGQNMNATIIPREELERRRELKKQEKRNEIIIDDATWDAEVQAMFRTIAEYACSLDEPAA